MRTTKPRKYGAGLWLSASLIVIWVGICVSGQSSAMVYGDNDTKRYHTGECAEKKLIKKKNLCMFASEAEAGARGFYPCRICILPSIRPRLKTATKRRLALPIVRGRAYVGEVKARVYHYYWCPLIKKNKHTKKVYFKTVGAAAKKGYTPCRECHPPEIKVPEYRGLTEHVPMVSLQKVEEEKENERELGHAREAVQRKAIKEQAQESGKKEAVESMTITEEDDE